MKEYARTQNMRDSLDDFLVAALAEARTVWLAKVPSPNVTFAVLQEDEELKLGTNDGVLKYTMPDESGDDAENLRNLALAQLDCVTRKTGGTRLARFLREYVFFKIGLVISRRSKEGFIPLKNIWEDPVSPITEDQIIVRQFDKWGWRQLLPGQEGSPLKDASAIHYYATLTFHY